MREIEKNEQQIDNPTITETPESVKETESKNTFNEGMQALADLINNPAPNRNITDFEGDDDD